MASPNPRFTLAHALLLSTGAVAGYAVRALGQRNPSSGNFWAKAFAPTPQLPVAPATPQVKPKRQQQWLANPGDHSTQPPAAHDIDLVWCVLRSGLVMAPRPAITMSWLQTGSSKDIMWWYPGAAQPDLPPPDYAEDGTSSVAPTPYQPHWLKHVQSSTAQVPWFLDDETPVWCTHRDKAVTGPQPAHRVNWQCLGAENDVTHYSRADPAIFEVLAKPAVFVAKHKADQWLANPGDRHAPLGLDSKQSLWYVERGGATGMVMQANYLRWEHYGNDHPADIMWYVPVSPTDRKPDYAPQFAALAPYGDWLPYVHAWQPVRGDDNILPRFLNPKANVWLQLRDLTVTGPLVASSVSWLHRGRPDDVLQYSRALPSVTWHPNAGDSSAVPKPLTAETPVWVKTRGGKVTGPHSAGRIMWLHDSYVTYPSLDVMFYTADPQP